MINVFRFKHLVDVAASGLAERDEIIASSLLTMLSGQSVFFYGPPGTAKSLIARRLAGLFQSSAYFECLMNRFTTPEEMFGPVSIRELKTEDRYVRKTDGFLPTADFAFLDEIWKSSPGILNALLTILNERKFRNGDKVENVPLKAIVAASNEIPASGQGLEALYDRFIMRTVVLPVSDKTAFEGLLRGGSVGETVALKESDKISNEEWQEMFSAVIRIKVSDDTLKVIHSIRAKLANEKGEPTGEKDKTPRPPIYVSDRRWIKAVQVAKTAAVVCGRDEVQPIDVLLLADCLWSRVEDRDSVHKIVADAVSECGTQGSSQLMDWQRRFDSLEKRILAEDPKSKAEAAGERIMNGVPSICVPAMKATGNREVYIPKNWAGMSDVFHPLDANGYSCKDVTCVTDGGGRFQLQCRGASETFDPSGDTGRVEKNPPQPGLAKFWKEAERLMGEVREIGASMKGIGESGGAGYPFVSPKRLLSIDAAYERNVKAAEEGEVRCEYLLHKITGGGGLLARWKRQTA